MFEIKLKFLNLIKTIQIKFFNYFIETTLIIFTLYLLFIYNCLLKSNFQYRIHRSISYGSNLSSSHLFELVKEIDTEFYALPILIRKITLVHEFRLVLQSVHSLLFQLNKVIQKSLKLIRVTLVVRLVFQKVKSFFGERKSCKQECFDREREVPILGFLRVLIHNISNDSKINNRLSNWSIFFCF